MKNTNIHPPWYLMWFFLAFGFAGLILQIKPSIEIDSRGEGGILQIFYTERNSDSAESSPTVVLPGQRTVSVSLPWSLQDRIRLDPMSHVGNQTIRAIHYRYLFFKYQTDLHDVTSLREPHALSIERTNENRLLIRSLDDDPRLSVPVPNILLAWRIIGAILALSPLLCLFLISAPLTWPVNTEYSPYQAALTILGINYAAFVYFIGWTDAYYPILDDWRYFYPGRFSLIEDHASWMKVAGNDTYFLTGQLIDWLLLKLSNGNTYLVRLFSLSLLAVFLAFAAALSQRHAGKWATFAILALCLTLTGRSYWTLQFIAYHQFIPVLCLFCVLWIMRDLPYKRLSWPSRLYLSLLTLSAGLAYISGSFLMMVMAVAYTVSALGAPKSFPRVNRLILWHIGLPALVTAIFQLYMVSSAQGSLLEESHAGKLVWPWEPRFWAFFVGLFGRATGLSGNTLILDIAVTALCIALAAYILARVVFNKTAEKEDHVEWVALSLFGASFVYAALVALGRAGLGAPPGADLHTVSAVAKLRFHYWWLAALLPIAVAIACDKILSKQRLSFAVMFLASLLILLGRYNYFIRADLPFYADLRQRNKEAEACVRATIVKHGGRLHGEIMCTYFYPVDLGSAVRLSEKKDMHFMYRLLQKTSDK